MKLDWNDEKNGILKRMRGVSFGDVEQAIILEKVLEIVEHPNQVKYPNQKIMYITLKDYVYCVPFVEDEDKGILFLKTIYPSRKVKKSFKENF